MPLTGMPTLSAIVAISRVGNDLADRLLDGGEGLADSSTRVPTGARTCIRIWPESTDGKKLRPRNGARANDATTKTMKPVMNSRAAAERHLQQVAIDRANASNRALEAALEQD